MPVALCLFKLLFLKSFMVFLLSLFDTNRYNFGYRVEDKSSLALSCRAVLVRDTSRYNRRYGYNFCYRGWL
jgi:hypothetical protein